MSFSSSPHNGGKGSLSFLHDDRLPSFCQCLRIAFHLQIFYLRQSESLSAGRLAWRINFRKNCVIASLTGVKSMEFPFIFSLGMGESRSISQKPKRILCKLWNGWKIRTNLYTIFDEVLCQQWDNSLSAAVSPAICKDPRRSISSL